jgi:hypothetical protein
MRSQKRWRGLVVGVILGVLFSAAVVLAGSLEPRAGATQAGLQGNSSSYLPIVLKAGGSSSAAVPRTGQTTSYGPRDDGALQKGVAWPNPRFTVSNGTVTDNLTGLIWLQNANCMDTVGGIDKISWPNPGSLTWVDALTWSNNLAAGKCGLSDGSTVGQWRLPNVKELQSLIDYAFYGPPLSNTAGTGKWTEGAPFTGVMMSNYWSSTTDAFSAEFSAGGAWYVDLSFGHVDTGDKTSKLYVWPVRSGQ